MQHQITQTTTSAYLRENIERQVGDYIWHDNQWEVDDKENDGLDIFLSLVINSKDPRAEEPDFIEAKK